MLRFLMREEKTVRIRVPRGITCSHFPSPKSSSILGYNLDMLTENVTSLAGGEKLSGSKSFQSCKEECIPFQLHLVGCNSKDFRFVKVSQILSKRDATWRMVVSRGSSILNFVTVGKLREANKSIFGSRFSKLGELNAQMSIFRYVGDNFERVVRSVDSVTLDVTWISIGFRAMRCFRDSISHVELIRDVVSMSVVARNSIIFEIIWKKEGFQI